MPNSFNGIIREYFADIADIDPASKSLNDCMRAGLEALGYSGSLNNMLKQWAKATAGAGVSINTAFRLALIDLGGTASSINTLVTEVMQDDSLTWGGMTAKWEDESRVWESIG